MNASRAESSRYAVIDKKPDPTEPDTADKSNAAESDTDDEPDAAERDAADKPTKKSAQRRVTVSLRSLVIAAVIVVVVVVVAGLGWLYVGAQRKLAPKGRKCRDSPHGKKIALDYAVNAGR